MYVDGIDFVDDNVCGVRGRDADCWASDPSALARE
jgi:hypothetical protein